MNYVIITQLKNQSKRIKDWILYHHNEGFDGFIIFDDFSEDSTEEEIIKVKNEYNINVIVKKTDGIGGTYDINNCGNSNSYGNDSSLNHRIQRSYTEGNNILKSINPEAFCAFIDVDEFFVTSSNKKIYEVINDLFLENLRQTLIISFDVRHDYDLNDDFIVNSKNLRWSYEFLDSHPVFFARGKSIIKSKFLDKCTFVHAILDPIPPSPHAEYSKEIRNYDLLRIHHYRVPNLDTNHDAISYVEDTILRDKLIKYRNNI